MARQVRSEATRRKILDAAVDVFNEVGYAAADRGAIIERTGMTKGAFYHHFDSMESLASAVITEGDLRAGLDPKMVSESIIGATFGARVLSQSTPSGNHLIGRLTQTWELFLPAIVTDRSLAYYREYLAREALRHVKHDPAT